MIASIWGRESGGRMTYNAVKAAEISLAKSMAQQLARDNIRVNSVAPGSILFPGGSWHKRQQDDPKGIAEFVMRENPAVRIDWHGHEDRGLSVANSLAALRAGAHRVHGCGLGVGERVGNTPLDQLLVNLQLLGWIDRDLSALATYVGKVSAYLKVPIPDGYPVVGRDAFRTGTGVHAAAIVKARAKGHDWLADMIYSGVPAAMVGLTQLIEVGPMSGESNVFFWLRARGIDPTPGRVAALYRAAKASDHVLSEPEIRTVLSALPDSATPGSPAPEGSLNETRQALLP